MNQQMVGFLREECKNGAPFHHLHGAGRDYEAVVAGARRAGVALEQHPDLEVREYIYDMPLVMAAADVVLCRAGASTISELAAIAKPAILVPSPNVTGDHQTKNAKVLAGAGGAVLLPEQECTPEKLYEVTADLLENREKRESMARALRNMAVPDAGARIYETLLELIAMGN